LRGQTGLEELARLERIRRISIKEDAREYRNEDLRRLQHARVGIARSVLTQSKRPAGTNRSESPATKSSEANWLAAAEKARNRLVLAVNRSHVLQLRINHLQNLYLNESEDHRLQLYLSELAATVKALDVAEREEENARADMENLENEARAAGVSASVLENLQQGLDSSSKLLGFSLPMTP
jgi:hypothetical protein